MMKKLSVNDFACDSCQCVHFLSAEAWEKTKEKISQNILTVYEIKVPVDIDKRRLLELISDAFDFPEYFGDNWDALEDCLCDLSWLPRRDLIFVVHDAEILWAKDPMSAGTLTEIWLASAGVWSEEERAFHIVFVL